ncbi:hypothetical protein V1226_04370 [Lachnospiraceae bacterium JLR.KK009]|nr:hypothetical protein C810_00510 [Lachnospiraceae bacterium A2]
MGKPSKYEKETIVNFNEGEKEASIYTFNADLKRRLAARAYAKEHGFKSMPGGKDIA